MFKTLWKTRVTIRQDSSGIDFTYPANLTYWNIGFIFYGKTSYE
ncbi:hypothetical protein [Bartonella apihabitans]|nr:hypothetical protein [Bartonella apihabitans]